MVRERRRVSRVEMPLPHGLSCPRCSSLYLFLCLAFVAVPWRVGSRQSSSRFDIPSLACLSIPLPLSARCPCTPNSVARIPSNVKVPAGIRDAEYIPDASAKNFCVSACQLQLDGCCSDLQLWIDPSILSALTVLSHKRTRVGIQRCCN